FGAVKVNENVVEFVPEFTLMFWPGVAGVPGGNADTLPVPKTLTDAAAASAVVMASERFMLIRMMFDSFLLWWFEGRLRADPRRGHR
ncbi:MAG: hypothetical protein KDB40_03775, partial [Acidimicrobiales bacterium]|nr:hypothetical protein [Acidimicrobiales bacterium]